MKEPIMINKVPRETLQRIFQLARQQPWILDGDDRVERVTSLIDECDSPLQQELVFSLISRFKFLSNNCVQDALGKIVRHLFDEMRLDPNTTEIAAMGVDSKADSSQEIVNQIKPILAHRQLGAVKVFSRCNKSPAKKDLIRHVVLVDEFVGSGQTAVNRIRLVRSRANQLEPGFGELLNVHICVVAATIAGIEHIKDECGCDVFAVHQLSKGISDFYTGVDLASATDSMNFLESMLADQVDKQELPQWGYGRSEALYARAGGNIPNNVFPLFWWEAYKNPKRDKRTPLFNRYVNYEAD